jgi:hypothetical protein
VPANERRNVHASTVGRRADVGRGLLTSDEERDSEEHAYQAEGDRETHHGPRSRVVRLQRELDAAELAGVERRLALLPALQTPVELQENEHDEEQARDDDGFHLRGVSAGR